MSGGSWRIQEGPSKAPQDERVSGDVSWIKTVSDEDTTKWGGAFEDNY